MSATYRLFERWTAHKGVQSERAAMLMLGLSPGTAQHWKRGRNASLAVLEKMASDLGEDYVPHVMAAFQETAPNESERKAWRRLAKRLGAAGVLAATCLVTPPPAYAITGANATENAPGLYIMRSGRKSRKLRKRVRMAGIGATHKGQSAHASALEVQSCCTPFSGVRRHETAAVPCTRSTDELLRPFGVRRRGGRQARPARRLGRLEIARPVSYIAR